MTFLSESARKGHVRVPFIIETRSYQRSLNSCRRAEAARHRGDVLATHAVARAARSSHGVARQKTNGGGTFRPCRRLFTPTRVNVRRINPSRDDRASAPRGALRDASDVHAIRDARAIRGRASRRNRRSRTPPRPAAARPTPAAAPRSSPARRCPTATSTCADAPMPTRHDPRQPESRPENFLVHIASPCTECNVSEPRTQSRGRYRIQVQQRCQKGNASVTVSRANSQRTRLPVVIDDDFAVLLRERSLLRRRQDVEHVFRRTAQPHAERRLDERAVDEDRMREHRVDELIVGEARIVEAEFGVRRALLAQRVAHGKPRAGDQRDERSRGSAERQVLDDLRLDSRVADQLERVARRAALAGCGRS